MRWVVGTILAVGLVLFIVFVGITARQAAQNCADAGGRIVIVGKGAPFCLKGGKFINP